ncbi:hypothetical protein CF65_01764 [Aggregatibacter actinomycetemcomitans HK1651]|nr:hypothetical protein CF65_01764 [Aggregatibacter actinomycetemcomitans HK1651]
MGNIYFFKPSLNFLSCFFLHKTTFLWTKNSL